MSWKKKIDVEAAWVLKIACAWLGSFMVTGLYFSLQKYKPFKGVKYVTRAGKFQVRT